VTVVATLLSLVVRHYIFASPYVLFVMAVAIATWYGGLGPGLLATLLGSVAGGYIFAPHLPAVTVFNYQVPLIPMASFAVAGAFVAVVIALVRSARFRAEADRRRATFLAAASEEMARSLDYVSTFRQVARMAVPTIADWCIVYTIEGGERLRPVAIASTSSTTTGLIADLARRYPQVTLLPTTTGEALRTGQAQLIPDVSESVLESMAPAPETLDILRRIATRSVIAVPLIAPGHTYGALALGTTESERRFGREDLQLAEELGRRAALAIDNARLYQAVDTAMRQKAEALALLDTLLAAAPVGLGLLDREFRFERLNEALAEMIGYSFENILGRSVADVLPELWNTLGPMLRSVLETGVPAVNLEVSGVTPAAPGVHRTWLVNYYPVRVDTNKVLGIGVVVMEITARKQAEEERERLTEQLAADHAWLRTVIERTPAGVVLIENVDGQRIVANQRAQELFGKPLLPYRGISQYAGQIYKPSDKPCAYEDLPSVRAFRGEKVPPEELVIHQPTGREVPILVEATEIRDGGGRVLGVVVVFEDISTLKELERLREEWTSVIAHDLRQPVTIISGYTDRLRLQMQRSTEREQQLASLDHIRAAADNLNRMIADLLDISRIEARRLTLQKSVVSFGPLVQSIVERLTAVTIGHVVRLEIASGIPPVDVDAARIEQVLGNLLSNAAKYSYPESDIVVTVKPVDHEVETAVTNRGEGIPATDLEHVFERFYRTRTAEASGVRGVGLGLYITKGLVEAHGGRIWVESIPGRTTTFYFTIPIPKSSDE